MSLVYATISWRVLLTVGCKLAHTINYVGAPEINSWISDAHICYIIAIVIVASGVVTLIQFLLCVYCCVCVLTCACEPPLYICWCVFMHCYILMHCWDWGGNQLRNVRSQTVLNELNHMGRRIFKYLSTRCIRINELLQLTHNCQTRVASMIVCHNFAASSKTYVRTSMSLCVNDRRLHNEICMCKVCARIACRRLCPHAIMTLFYANRYCASIYVLPRDRMRS